MKKYDNKPTIAFATFTVVRGWEYHISTKFELLFACKWDKQRQAWANKGAFTWQIQLRGTANLVAPLYQEVKCKLEEAGYISS